MSAQLRNLSTIWSALCGRCPLPPTACVYRITEGHHAERVRRHGTDRFGLDRPLGCTQPPWTATEWRRFGYSGPFRPFVDVIYGSTADEVEASVAGQGTSAFSKIAVTEQPHIIVYRADALDAVHTGQYAFRDGGRRREALVLLVSVASLGSESAPP